MDDVKKLTFDLESWVETYNAWTKWWLCVFGC